MPYYLGIDGGGSKTTCAVGDDVAILATATAGPSNVVRVGEARARESLHRAISQACSTAGIDVSQVQQTCIGASGGGREETAWLVAKILSEIIPGKIAVVGDIQIALQSAFGSGPGVIVIAGTGSIAYGRNEQGSTARAGGWGFAVSDEGSAHWIGRAAVAAALRATDRGEGTPENAPHQTFVTALCKAWGVNSVADLASTANSFPPPDFAALFPAVAASTDNLALAVLSSAGKELAYIAAIVTGRLFADAVKTIPIAMVGGVFRHSSVAREGFYNELRRLEPRSEIDPEIVEPIEGALHIARTAVP